MDFGSLFNGIDTAKQAVAGNYTIPVNVNNYVGQQMIFIYLVLGVGMALLLVFGAFYCYEGNRGW